MTVRYDDFMAGTPLSKEDYGMGSPPDAPAKVSSDPYLEGIAAKTASRNIPDYTEHLRARQEAANKTRESFQNRMQPTIHVQLQVRKVVAGSYKDAVITAHTSLYQNDETYAVLVKLDAVVFAQFSSMARAAREVDGTYTVTLP